MLTAAYPNCAPVPIYEGVAVLKSDPDYDVGNPALPDRENCGNHLKYMDFSIISARLSQPHTILLGWPQYPTRPLRFDDSRLGPDPR